MRLAKLAAAILFAALAVVAWVVGFFWLLFNESGSTEYVTLAGRHVRAHSVGATALIVAAGLTVAAVRSARGQRGSGSGAHAADKSV